MRYLSNLHRMFSKRSVSWLIVVLFKTLSVWASDTSGQSIDSLMRSEQWKHKKQLEQLANDIMKSFRSEEDRFRAAFAWTAQNISYDLASLNDRNLYDNRMLVINALQKRSALCEGYVAVLDSLSRLMKISTVKVPGYTRWQRKLQPEPHLWLAVRLSGSWHLADPTWCSGSIVNGRYQAGYDISWFLVPPAKMIHTHMPYDPIWQLLPQPLSHTGFIQNNGSVLQGDWQTSDSVEKFVRSTQMQQNVDELRRLRQGISHKSLQTRISFLEQAISIQHHNQVVEIMQQSNALFNAALQDYNAAVDAYNQRKPRPQVLAMLVRATQVLESARNLLPQYAVPPTLHNEMKMMQKQIYQLEERLREAERKWY